MTDERAPVRRFMLVAVWLPLAVTAVAVIVQLLALPHVPDPVAIHWGTDGRADGFGPSWLPPLLTVVLGLGLPLLLACSSLPGLRRGDRGPSYRFMGAVAAATSTLVAVLTTWTLIVQVGLDAAADARLSGWTALFAFLVAGLAGVVAWFVQPRRHTVRATAQPAPTLTLDPGERAAWFAETTLPRGAVAAIVTACVGTVAAAVTSWFVGGDLAVSLVLGLVAGVLVVAALTTAAFRVRVDEAGLAVTGVLGAPRFRVPLADVAAVALVEVNPVGEFGGYGLRALRGRTGIVLRRGPAIEVTRTSGRRLVVTVAEAAAGAALLQALAQRARQARRLGRAASAATVDGEDAGAVG